MKQFILVAGVNYAFEKDGRAKFRLLCQNRMRRILARARAKEDMLFQIFDFNSGEIVTHAIAYSTGKRLEKVTRTQRFKPISQLNYRRDPERGYVFRDGQVGVMSILDVYQAVQQVGAVAPHTLAELSFFSHGWRGGPILVNSDDNARENLTARDPNDKDPRAGKDFTAPTMDASALSQFQTAFNGSGQIWIWGCAFEALVNQILTKIERNPVYRDHGLSDEIVFKFRNLSQQHVKFFERFLSEFLPPFPNKQQIEIPFQYLKYIICQYTIASYSHHIAERARIRTYGSLIGTWAGYDPPPLGLMRVDRSLHRHVRFYKNYLGFDFDPEGRDYGEYKPDFSCAGVPMTFS
jgi:hypothetical protein